MMLIINGVLLSDLKAEQTKDLLTLVPDPPPLEASSYYLLDFDSGQTIAAYQADTPIPPASLTKIMTVYVTFKELVEGRLKLTDSVPISENAWRTEGSRMFLEPNKPATVEELLRGIIIQSGNDASVALAEHISGNEATFAQLMNQTAQSLQMTNTHFENSMGLPSENHYTTAHDLGILTRALIMEFPQYYGWHSEKEYTYNKITQRNRNKLLWRDSTVDGVKTGHTEEAGYSLVASALRDGRRLISIVTGTKSTNARANANQALLNYGFRFFATKQIFSDTDTIAEPRIWMGELKTIPAGLNKTLYVTAPSRYADQLNSIIDVEQNISAPVEKGQTLGSVKVMLGDSVITEQPLVALDSVQQGGLLRRLYDQTYRFIKETTGYPKD
ncbi:MAG: D-alanyl-D-alanine carboxypeptidase [Gammaproteobacteria bacterium]|nr:D-alanyl-D-alanine carboxypeptidase [Gammaproteobacteria bacterium]